MKRFLTNPLLLVWILIAALIGGAYSLTKLNYNLFPNMNYPLVNIITHSPGASSYDVETLITRPIENQMSGLLNVRRVSSVSQNGLSNITVIFNWGVSNRVARAQVQQALAQAQTHLPTGLKPVLENLGSNLLNIADYGVQIDTKGLTPEQALARTHQITQFCKIKLNNFLRTVPGINHIDVVGGETETFAVTPNALKMVQNNLSYENIAEAITQQNKQKLLGFYDENYQSNAITGQGILQTSNDIKQVPLPNLDKNQQVIMPSLASRPLLLSHIAQVDSGSLPKRYQVHINGRPGLDLMIYKNPNADTIKVVKGIQEAFKKLTPSFPEGMKIIPIYDQSKLIGDSAHALTANIIEGIGLVAIMLVLFLGSLRNSFIVALSVPTIVVITFMFMDWLNLSLNMMTLGAMAVAVGMVVDDSIIVIENIIRHREMGKPPLQAALEGTKEIAAADASGTLTTIAAFVPCIFLTGIAGIFTQSFGWVISIMLLLSLIISLSIIPAYMAHQRNIKLKPPLVRPLIDWAIQFNLKMLNRLLKHPKKTLLGSVLILILSAGAMAFNPISFLPKIDEGAMLMEYHLPPGTSLTESNRVGNKIEKIALKNPNVDAVYRRTGSEAGSLQIEPVDVGELILHLKPVSQRKDTIDDVKQQLRKATASIQGIILFIHPVTSEKLDESMSGMPTLFGLTLYGDNYTQLLDIADRVSAAAKTLPEVSAVVNSAQFRVPQILIKPNAVALAKAQISTEQLFDEIRYQVAGQQVAEVIKNQQIIPIFLRAKNGAYIQFENLGDLNIQTLNGPIPLRLLAHIEKTSGPSEIDHINLQRVVTLPMEVEGNVSTVESALMQKINQLHLPKDVVAVFGGEYQLFIKTGISFALLIVVSGILIYLIMAFQLGNNRHPIAILLRLPLSFSGAFIAMAITGAEINLSFFIGLITLLGVGVNNGIVLVDYINKYRAEGMSELEAIEKGVQVRTRPVLLTVFTAIIALMPIALGIGTGSEMQQSLAICVIGGLMSNIFFTLNVLPVLYRMVDKEAVLCK